ncbi:MAG: phytanoyl-CoA dioxygenase family protein [Planctomycetota bacterium]|nr:phytanoyl-CoA dioxygenase family protein [Planctomycetota bacterium]MDA0919515.1 phytanoyl-CoA dioxygenase family protein [Planctomycetota bacterium]MDA1158341.1 phytanoyl-CoA dioxygenase family protein [Planctomycetota bacterium]
MFDCQVHGKPVPLDVLGGFRDSTEVMTDSAALQARMREDGYVFLRGVVGPSSIAMARKEVFGRLAEVGEIAEPPVEGIFTGQSQRPDEPAERGRFWQSVSEGPALRRVTHGPEMQYVLDTLFGEPSRGYEFIFLRPGVKGRFTFLHYDLPFFSRGTKNVVTAWTAIGDIPTVEGSLFVLENSHRFDDLIEPIQTIDYNSKDSPQVQMMGDAIEFARSRGSRLLTENFQPGDVILFGMTTMHGSFDNCSPVNRTRLSVDVRWQPASEPIDERYFGSNPAGTTGIGYAELNGAKPLTEPWHTR